MSRSPLISATELADRVVRGASVRVFDCSFELSKPAAGRAVYDAGHVPGADYLSLDDDLSGAKTGRNGRHPLPAREVFVARLAARGVDDDTLVVGYDTNGGTYAARLWWMLRWIGHAESAVLDGGLAVWQATGFAITRAPAPVPPRPGQLTLRPPLVAEVGFDEVLANLSPQTRLVIDARSPERFRGENETLDPVGGRIPGSRNRFFRANLLPDGRFKPPEVLRAEFEAVLQGAPAGQSIASCGSGVTACHNLLAMEVAGLAGGALYPGSWSEWCAQPGAPQAAGPG